MPVGVCPVCVDAVDRGGFLDVSPALSGPVRPVIICHSRRYLFIHLHKTGGTSVEAALAPTLAWNDLLLGSTPFGEQCNLDYQRRFGLTKHSSLAEIYHLCASCAPIRDYRVVTVVREPLQRTVSLFNFIAAVIERIRVPLDLDLLELSRRRDQLAPEHPQLDWPAARAFLEAQLDFDAFVASPSLESARGFQSQVSQLSDRGALARDLCWLTTERLDEADALLAELAGTPVTLEHLNASPQRLISAAAVSVRTRQWLRQRFAEDYDTFGFSA